jgi:hypothetical protein
MHEENLPQQQPDTAAGSNKKNTSVSFCSRSQSKDSPAVLRFRPIPILVASGIYSSFVGMSWQNPAMVAQAGGGNAVPVDSVNLRSTQRREFFRMFTVPHRIPDFDDDMHLHMQRWDLVPAQSRVANIVCVRSMRDRENQHRLCCSFSSWITATHCKAQLGMIYHGRSERGIRLT